VSAPGTREEGAAAGLDAMVFAAGLGTRLAPLTDGVPKALVKVGDEPVLCRVVRQLAAAGADRIVVNAHPFADRVAAHLEALEEELARERGGRGPRLLLSLEAERPLETGGGLLHALPFFRGDGPILLHNVDVLTAIDLPTLVKAHRRSGALATLAVQDRPSSRRLRFDDVGLLGREGDAPVRDPEGTPFARAFAGVHVAAPDLLALLAERGGDPVFSIVEAYLELAAAGHRVAARDVTGAAWYEIGTPARLERAREAVLEGAV